MKLLNEESGWVSTGGSLLLTTDSGEQWKDISPPNPANAPYQDVFFLDAQTGWVLIAHLAQPDEGSASGDWSFHLMFTTDGGGHWSDSPLKLPPSAAPVAGSANLTFADRLHGWVLFDYATGGAFSESGMLETSDGGRTWHPAQSDPGFYGDIEAYPNGDLWVVGGPGGNDELAVRYSHASEFESRTLVPPPTPAGYDSPKYRLPAFTNPSLGTEVVQFSTRDGSRSESVLFTTSDGGRTWRPNRRVINIPDEQQLHTTVAGSEWLICLGSNGPHPSLHRVSPGEAFSLGITVPQSLAQCGGMSFVSATRGWLNCTSGLLSTTDGGATWTDIAPR